MSDFERVLERLLGDASFKAALAANPASALAGYSLDADEREVLATQLVSGSGADRTVESRTSKSSVVGLFGPVVASFGIAAGGQSMGSAWGSESPGSAPGDGQQAMGRAPDPFSDGQAVGDAGPMQGVGAAPSGSSKGEAPQSAPAEATGYRSYVDVDGDGSWDAYMAYERADGGVDIHADVDEDGRVDFIGRDFDRDGLVDEAVFDTDLDGVMDLRMYDDTGNGWMDRGEPTPQEGESQAFGSAPSSG